jgi:ABC-type dipeptide/oligopeptide/nickel transport system ATPase subunit
VLSVEGLTKRYRGAEEAVLRGVDLRVPGGTVVALLGRSGSGKTTLARCLTGLEAYDRGSFQYNGTAFRPGDRESRRTVQLVWQDPLAALSPYRRVRDSIREPLEGAHRVAKEQQMASVNAVLEFTGLAGDRADCYPFQLSGGEAQRAVIARALVARPPVLILDEPLASLDPLAQRKLIPLLREAVHAHTMSVILISHDLPVVALLADQVAFLHEGRIIEVTATSAFLRAPESRPAKEFVEAARQSSFRLPRET